jgi:sterol desaturase/sphingolipid hydroxylase (fatty acid hydroxylase superfamily)
MEAIAPVLFPLVFVAMLVLERVFPARPLPKVRFWLLKGLVFFVVVGALMGAIPAVVTKLAEGRIPSLHLASLGLAGALIGFGVLELFAYAVHRLMHNVPLLWRWTHQMHHSAERVDIAGASYFHPNEVVLRAAINGVVALVLGLSPDAAALAGFLAFFAAMFQHLNVRTPQWVGWILQRPEAHSVHHARGVHAYNYGNLMLWDILFGTFRNPATFTGEQGFYDGASSRVGAMLVGRDVSNPR